MQSKISYFYIFLTVLVFSVSLIFYTYKKYNYDQLNNKLYIFQSEHNINILKAINNNKINEIEYLAAFEVANDIINVGRKNKLEYDINFKYLCNHWDKNLTLIQYIRKGLSSQIETKKTVSIYQLEKENIDKGIDALNTACDK